MDPATAHFLIAPAGARLLARAREVRALSAHRRVDALRREASAEHVRAALRQDDLRRRAAARCPHAERLLFTEEALEQATAWPVAADRATRWPGASDAPLVDLTAGIGLDTLATAETGRPVVACERDPVRALLLGFNAEALGLASRIDVRAGDAREAVAGGLAGPLALLDPGRRPGGHRTRAPEAFEPPIDAWEGLLAPFGAAMVKLPPARRDLGPGGLVGPEEVVSLAGRARERRLLQGGAFGDLPPRRAIRLPDGASVSGPGTPWPAPRAPREGDWLLDPDVSVTLAGLVGDLAAQQDLRPIHPQIAYLLGTEPIAGLPGQGTHVEAILPPRAGALNRWLADRGVGQLTLRSRGVADPMATWRKRLRPRGRAAGTLVFTRGPSDRWLVLAGRTVPMTGE